MLQHVGLMLAQQLQIYYNVGTTLPQDVGSTEGHFARMPFANIVFPTLDQQTLLQSTDVGPMYIQVRYLAWVSSTAKRLAKVASVMGLKR